MRIEVQRQDLTRLLNGITRVVETSNAVPVLRNVVLSSSGGTLTARGTNLDIEITTSCPCSDDTDAPDGAVGMPGVIVSTKVASLAIAFKAPIDVSVCATRIRLVAPGTEICAKLIEGTYPDYARVVPQASNRMLRVDKAELASAVGRVGVVASESAGKPIRLNIAPGSIHLVAKDSDGREAVDEVAIEFDGEPTFVAYNTKFLDDMLAAVPGDTVEFDITDNTTTTRVRSVSDAAFVGVLTPFRMAA